MPDRLSSELLARYLSGEASDEEKARIEAFIREDVSRQKFVDELRHLWDAAGRRPVCWDVEEAWKHAAARMSEAEREQIRSGPRVVRGASSRPAAATPRLRHARKDHGAGVRMVPFLRAAAILAAMTIGAVLLYQSLRDTEPVLNDQLAHVYVTESGQQSTIRLADGSRIMLNVASKLTVPATFGETDRRVFLEGEAYFNVESHDTLGFVVENDRSTVEVLGTSFSVTAYPQETVTVAVAEGTVSVRGADVPDADAPVLQPRDVAVLNGDTWQVRRSAPNVDRYFAWTEKRLVFDRDAFDHVTRQLGRWYGLQIESTVPSHSVDRLTATFSDEPLSEILNIVANALGLRYERDRDRITFYAR